MNRRTLLAGLGSLSTIGLAGCLNTLGLAEHKAAPAGVSTAAREETGYAQTNIDELVISRDVGISAYSEEITVTNYLTEHEKTVRFGPLGEQRAAVFMVLATPQVEIMGEDHNPVAEMSAEELVDLIESNYDKISNISPEGEQTVPILGEDTPITKFTADAEFNGYELTVNMHVSEAVPTAEDLIVGIGVYPRDLESSEAENVRQLMENITETAEDESNGSDSGGNTNGNESSGGGGSADGDGSEDNSSTGTDDGLLP